jgi:hypothetical protein
MPFNFVIWHLSCIVLLMIITFYIGYSFGRNKEKRKQLDK